VHVQRFGYHQNEEIKTGSMSFIDCHESEINGLLYSIVKSVWGGGGVRYVTTTQKRKAIRFNIAAPLFRRKKSSGLIFSLENACSLFLKLRNLHSPDYTVKGTKSKTEIYMKTLKRMKQSVASVGE
jgi:hypothetical protein